MKIGKWIGGAAIALAVAGGALAAAYVPGPNDLFKVYTKQGGTYHDVNLFTTDSGALCGSTTVTVSGTGFGTGPAVTGEGCAMDITTGTSNAAATGTITFSQAAPHGWVCTGSDITTKSTTVALLQQTANTTTTAVIRNYTDVMGTGSGWTDGDHLYVMCLPY